MTGDKLDTQHVFDKALEVFSKQALVSIDEGNTTTLSSIELAKAKSNAFLDAVANVVTIKHEMDIANASDEAFKRKDELDLLNTLRKQSTAQAKTALKLSEYINTHVEKAIDSGDELDVSAVMGLLDMSADMTTKIIDGASKLIKLERMSGNRQWGRRDVGQANITYIQGLDNAHNDNDHIGKALEYFNARNSVESGKFVPRKLTLEDFS